MANVLHCNGSTWAFIKSGSAGILPGVWGVSGSAVFPVGLQEIFLKFNKVFYF